MPRWLKALLLLVLAAAVGVFAYSARSLYRIRQNYEAGTQEVQAQNETVLSHLRTFIPETTPGTVLHPTSTDDALYALQSGEEQTEMTVESSGQTLQMLEIQGFSCVGILEVPVRGLAWAVVDASSDTDDCYLPAVTGGYPADGDLMIKGFNNEAQFAVLKELAAGNEVTFTDVNGILYSYEVISTARLPHEQVQKTLEGASTGLVVTSEAMRETGDIDLQLYFEVGSHDRYVVDCRAVSG